MDPGSADLMQSSPGLRRRLAGEAYARTAAYDAVIAEWFASHRREAFPTRLTIGGLLKQTLRYGENPHQQAAFYRDSRAIGASVTTAQQVQGRELSYNNIADSDTALECVRQFDAPACVIVKHANPCGAALARAHAKTGDAAAISG